MIPSYLTGMILGVITILYIINHVEHKKARKRFDFLMDKWEQNIKNYERLRDNLMEQSKKMDKFIDSKK